MSDLYNLYTYIVKTAAPEDEPPGAKAWWKDRANDFIGYRTIYNNLGDAYTKSMGPVTVARDRVFGLFNPFEDEVKKRQSVSYRLGHEIGDFLLPKVYDPENLGPYEEYSNYLKETERGDMLLHEAAKLRRRARLLKRLRKKEEEEKDYASRSRYF